MKIPDGAAASTIRLSCGRFTSDLDILTAVASLVAAVVRGRDLAACPEAMRGDAVPRALSRTELDELKEVAARGASLAVPRVDDGTESSPSAQSTAAASGAGADPRSQDEPGDAAAGGAAAPVQLSTRPVYMEAGRNCSVDLGPDGSLNSERLLALVPSMRATSGVSGGAKAVQDEDEDRLGAIPCVLAAGLVERAEPGKEGSEVSRTVLSLAKGKGEMPLDAGACPVDGAELCVVLSATVFHPQGGGQPSDIGAIAVAMPLEGDADSKTATLVLQVLASRKPGAGADDALAGCILLWCKQPAIVREMEPAKAVLHVSEAIDGTADKASGDLAAAEALEGATPCDPISSCLPILLKSNHGVWQSVGVRRRRSAMLLHSGGHLLDHCMGVLGMLQAPPVDGKAIEGAPADRGMGLRPGKGYHFEDGPFVEYQGAVPAPMRKPLIDALNRELCLAAEAGEATQDLLVDPSDGAALAAVGLGAGDCAHLPQDRPCRVVCIGSSSNGCPCGGTHVPSAAAFRGLTATASGGTGEAEPSGASACRITVQKLKVKKGKTSVKYSCDFS